MVGLLQILHMRIKQIFYKTQIDIKLCTYVKTNL